MITNRLRWVIASVKAQKRIDEIRRKMAQKRIDERKMN